MQQAAARENKDNKEVKERAERARAARAEREGAAATAEAYRSALGLSSKHDWGAKPGSKPAANPSGACWCQWTLLMCPACQRAPASKLTLTW